MRLLICSITLIIFLGTTCGFSQDYGKTYINEWKKFYPSKAVAQGMHASIFQYEDLALQNIEAWIQFNKKMLTVVNNEEDPYVKEQRIDARLLRIQIQNELDIWEKDQPQYYAPSLYTKLMQKAVKQVLDVTYLTTGEKASLICERMKAVQRLSDTARNSLKNSSTKELEIAQNKLKDLVSLYAIQLSTIKEQCSEFNSLQLKTIASIQSLIAHLREKIPTTPSTNILGRDTYARKLALYTDNTVNPNQLETKALQEIHSVKKLIGEISSDYLQKTYPNKTLPTSSKKIIQLAFKDMEKDAPKNGQEYLQFWQDLAKQATQFIEDKDIATLPKFQTLRILPAPESAGPAARIGWVDSAPPFAPNPLTTLYLPSIPDTLPLQEQVEFWASFNKPFNRMIVIHELFPGHYMQIKISRETPHPVRLLFPYALYFEGWATFTERVLLDAGWEKDNPLTFLAHLRKRLENANRAYTSMQVHCNGWTAEQVMEFSTNTSLVAPQFAKSLWGRIMRSPMQLTSYFLGGQQFAILLKSEKERLGEAFNLKDFMDTVMQVGAIPIDEFSTVFASER